jgi:thiol-disulfide isomerase/thioredoxin
MKNHIILNSENTNQKVNLKQLLKKYNLLVKFYSDTCGYCTQMQNDWNDAVNKIYNSKNKKSNKLVVLEVESSQMDNFEDGGELKNQVMGYPTIMFVKKGNKVKSIPFNEERISSNFVNFAFKNIKNSVELKKTKNMKKSKKNKTNKKKKSRKTKKNKNKKSVRFNI